MALLPLHAALASEHSVRATAAELPCGEAGISFAWGEGMERLAAARKAEKERGGGQRFMPNPGANWGPKARATGCAASGGKGEGEAV